MFDKDNVKRTIEVLKGKVKEDFDFTLTDAEMLLHMERAQIERRNEYIARQLKCIPSDGLRFLIEEARKPVEEDRKAASMLMRTISAKEVKTIKKAPDGRKKNL